MAPLYTIFCVLVGVLGLLIAISWWLSTAPKHCLWDEHGLCRCPKRCPPMAHHYANTCDELRCACCTVDFKI